MLLFSFFLEEMTRIFSQVFVFENHFVFSNLILIFFDHFKNRSYVDTEYLRVAKL